MNMNQYNQVTVPLALMNAVMNAMQTQPQLQHAGGVPNTINGLTVPQQLGLGYPNFVLPVQGPQLQPQPQPQPQPVPGPSSAPQLGGQPWALPAFQAANAPQPSGPQSNAAAKQPTVEEIVAGVVTAMKAAPQEAAADESAAVAFAPGHERVLVNALRKAKAEGLTPLQGFAKLDQVNAHTSAAWKDYFIRHVERLGPKVYPQAYANPAPATSKCGPRSKHTAEGPSTSSSRPRRPITGSDTSDSEESTPDEDAAPNGSATHRSKRGAPVVEYHEEVRIPLLPPGVKPEPPRRDSQHSSSRFTKEDKIFFIQYLKYRLHKGPVPSKEKLYRELAKQAPHHNADSWKRHWDNACTLPNEIYIKARKRMNASQKTSRRAAPRRQQTGSRPAELGSDEDESGDEQEGDASAAEKSDDSVQEPVSTATADQGKGGSGPQRSRVSDEDIQEMARYIVDKRKCDGWEALPAHIRWAEFGNRPENAKRTVTAWIQITYTRAKDLKAYIDEYEGEQAPESAAEEKPPRGPPTVDRTASPPRRISRDRQTKGSELPSKRALGDEEIKSEERGSQKRAKLAEFEAIVISD